MTLRFRKTKLALPCDFAVDKRLIEDIKSGQRANTAVVLRVSNDNGENYEANIYDIHSDTKLFLIFEYLFVGEIVF